MMDGFDKEGRLIFRISQVLLLSSLFSLLSFVLNSYCAINASFRVLPEIIVNRCRRLTGLRIRMWTQQYRTFLEETPENRNYQPFLLFAIVKSREVWGKNSQAHLRLHLDFERCFYILQYCEVPVESVKKSLSGSF